MNWFPILLIVLLVIGITLVPFIPYLYIRWYDRKLPKDEEGSSWWHW